MTDSLTTTYLVVIGLCLPPLAYLLPQDRAVVHLVDIVRQRAQRRRLRRWVDAQRPPGGLQ
jgi:hypothetical protein